MDSHVNYVHRNAVVVARTGFIARGAQGEHPIFVGNGFGGDVAESNYMRQNPLQDLYADGRKWPKTTYRRLWTWLTRPLAERARRHIPPPRSARWCGGHHLPGMFRAEFGWDLYTRMCVPVEEHLTRVWYYHCLRPKSALGRIMERLAYAAIHRWIIEYNFSRQDERVMINQRYDTPEKLSSTDAEVIQWRRLVVTKHFGGRDAPFEYKNPDGLSPDAVPLERVSVRYLQEQRAEGRPMTISRRRLLQTLACGAARLALARATPARAAATPPEWRQVVAAAKKEGKVVVNTFPGDGYKRALKAFTQAYPDIKLEHTGLHSQEFAPRIMQERQASLFTWDVATIPTSTALQVLRPAGVWDPVRPAIVLPEALDDAGWEGGFERGFAAVKDRALAYGFCAVRGAGITINTDMVKEDIKGLTDLLNPRWKGKLLLPDVRTMGDSFWSMTSARLNLGDDIIKKLFVDQEPALSRDTRQIAEFMVRGRYPIALGVNPLLLGQFQKQGLGKNLKTFHFPEMDTVNSSSSVVWLVNRAPHPAAAKVFINWLLTKDAQIVWAREVETNSRRVGVEPGNPQIVVPRNAKLLQVDAEENLAEVVKTQDIAKAVIK